MLIENIIKMSVIYGQQEGSLLTDKNRKRHKGEKGQDQKTKRVKTERLKISSFVFLSLFDLTLFVLTLFNFILGFCRVRKLRVRVC